MKRFFTLVLLAFCCSAVFSQQVMLQGWYWDYPSSGVTRYAQVLGGQSQEFADAGFTHVWLPPMSRASSTTSVGYDIKDYYDLGDPLQGKTKFGLRSDVDQLINDYDALGMGAVADMVYNHRTDGDYEDNPAVEGWVENIDATKINSGDMPYPPDRYRCYLPLGGSSGNNAGTYYLKFRSASQHSNFYSRPYSIWLWTNTVSQDFGATPIPESEPNGGGDCGEAGDVILLGTEFLCEVDNGGCGIDEFALTINAGDFDPMGDTLWITFNNSGASSPWDFSDHYLVGLWSANDNADIQNQIGYQTRTDFTNLPSGNGGMSWQNFKPNGNATQLNGEQDLMYWFYDIDHSVPSTQTAIFEWTKWMWQDVGVKGMRIDAVKHFPAWFFGDLLDFMHDENQIPEIVVGEFFDYNPGALIGWVNEVKSYMDNDTKQDINVRVFDFAMRGALKAACDQFGYDTRDVFGAGIVNGGHGSGFDVVTFVDNHDFRHGDDVQSDEHLAYAYMLSNNQIGTPTVYLADYENDTLRSMIDGLIELQSQHITGATNVVNLNAHGSFYSGTFSSGYNETSLLFQLQNTNSGNEVIMAINFAGEPLSVTHTIEGTNLQSGQQLTDIFGIGSDATITVSNNYEITFEIPARSFTAFVQGDHTQNLIDISPPTGITSEALEAFEISLFPNPVHSELRFNIDTDHNLGQLDFQIINIEGKVVKDFESSIHRGNHSFEIDVRPWPSGSYQLIVQGDKIQQNIPFVKQ